MIYCQPCHDARGDGKGILFERPVQLSVARHGEPDPAAVRMLHGPAAIAMLDHHGGLETEFAPGFHDLLGLPLRAERAEFVL